MAARSPRDLDPALLERALAAWREHDVARAIHPADREAVRATEAARALVLELFDRPARDLYNACAQLGRLLGDAGASPSLAATTIDGAALALSGAGIAYEPSRLAPARGALAEGYVAAMRAAEREDSRRAWEYPACVVPLDDTMVAIAAGYPSDDGERAAEWAGRVAAKLSKAGVRTAVVSGGELAKREITDALVLVGIAVPETLPARGWLRLPWRK